MEYEKGRGDQAAFCCRHPALTTVESRIEDDGPFVARYRPRENRFVRIE
ncbi:MAG: hypothetical protein JW736_04580 [Deltaproteobacteria bacterium]|nr:hypothetical protein [Deltaproteobacteria bacterium]